MSSLDALRRASRLGFVLALTVGLSACLRPLYGPTASGERLETVLAAIDVAEVDADTAHDRFGHYLRSELIFDLNGSGVPAPKRYRLAMSYRQQVQSPIIDTATGRATSATVEGHVNYKLTALDGREVANGIAVGHASYDRSPQRFATVRAARDAEIRLAKVLSEQIKNRLAVALVGGA
jgi:LPS-assembly lipoprotein